MSDLETPFRPSDIPTNLVGYWKFNNDATDEQGTYDLTASGTPAYVVEDYWKSGEYSTDLNGAIPMYFTRADADALDFVNAFSFAGWIKADDITTTTIVDKGSGATGYALQIDASSKLVLNMNNGARATSATALSAGKWTHVAGVYTQAAAIVYINGNLDNTSAYSTDCQATATDLHIAVEDDASTAPFDGHIKDLAVWDAALTPIQIKSLALGVDLDKYAYRPDDVSTAPTAWWKLNEVSGNATDSSGNSHTGTDTNTVLSSGGYIEGIARDFETGSNEYFAVTDDTAFDFSGGVWSMSAWVRAESLGIHNIISHPNNADNYFKGTILANGGIQLYVNATGVVVNVLSDTGIISIDTWYHVAVTEDGDTWKIYLDGIDVTASGGDDAGRCANYTGTFRVGGGQIGTQCWDGEMQDVAIWKGYALTAAEIKSLACALPIQRQGIVSYWKLDEESGTRADAIGSNTLADNNSVLYGTGKVDNAADFEQSQSEYLSIAHASQTGLDIVTDFALITWAKPESFTGSPFVLIDKDAEGDGYGLEIDTGGGYYNLRMRNESGTRTTASALAGRWDFIVGQFTGAYREIYFNAILQDSDAYTTVCSDTTSVFTLGARNDPGRYFDGLMDETIVTIRYFRPEEIKAVYLKGLNGKEVTSSEVDPTPAGSASSFLMFF